jgi:glycosyltransferase involved in cell wall biosynthesis
MTDMSFSVIVPFRDRGPSDREDLRCCLGALLHTSPRPFEIILVDDGSDAPTEDLLADLPGVCLVREDKAGPAAARNRGAARAAGNVLVFVDADIEVPPDVFERLALGFESAPDVAAIWGTVTAEPAHGGLVNRYKNLSHRHFTLKQGDRCRHLTTMCAAVRREVFERFGGFDVSFSTPTIEDVDLGRRLYDAGETVRMDRGIACRHRHHFTLANVVPNDFRKVRWMARTTLLHRQHRDPSTRVEGPAERREVRYLVGVPLGAAAFFFLLFGRFRRGTALTLLLLYVERDFWTYLFHEGGPLLALGAVPLMLLERTNAAVALVAGTADWLCSASVQPGAPASREAQST